MNLPNKITLSRVLLIPVFMIFLFLPYDIGTMTFFHDYHLSPSRFIAVCIFAILSLTDWLDGYLARKNNLVTNFGKFLDPLADKLLMTAGFVSLVGLNLAPAWMVIVILSREFAVTGLRLIAAGTGEVMAAAFIGKLKTTLQIISILLLLLNFTGIFSSLMLWAAMLITVYSGVEYFIKSKHVFSGSK